jgi:hypothetical protein
MPVRPGNRHEVVGPALQLADKFEGLLAAELQAVDAAIASSALLSLAYRLRRNDGRLPRRGGTHTKITWRGAR